MSSQQPQFTRKHEVILIIAVIAVMSIVGPFFVQSAVHPATGPVASVSATSPALGAQSLGGGSVQDPATFKSLNVVQGLTFRSDASQIIPGVTSLSLRNSNNTADNFICTDAGNCTIRGNGSVGGDLSVTGVITAGGSYVGITPVPTATIVPSPTPVPTLASPVLGSVVNNFPVGIGPSTPPATATPLVLINNTGNSNSLSVRQNSTPVFVVSAAGNVTGLVVGSATSNVFIQCGNTNVTASATFTPIAGATPVGNPVASLGVFTGDAANVAAAYSAGTFTLTVGHLAAGTPASNTTPAPVQWCYLYNK